MRRWVVWVWRGIINHMNSRSAPKWLPTTLLSRLILAMALLVTVVMMGFAAYTAYRDQQNLIANIEQQTTAVANQLLAAGTNYLITDNCISQLYGGNISCN